MKSPFMSVSKKWPTSPALDPNYSLKNTAKAHMLYESILQFPKNHQLARPAPDSRRAVNRQPGYRPGDS